MARLRDAERRRAPGRREAGSQAGSHTDERLPGSPDFTRQPTGTPPRSRTGLNECGCLYGYLRIKRLVWHGHAPTPVSYRRSIGLIPANAQGGEHQQTCRTRGSRPGPPCMAPVAPLFHPLPSYADAAGSSLHQRGEDHPAPLATPQSLVASGGASGSRMDREVQNHHCQCQAGKVVHPLAIGQDRPSKLGPPGEGRSASRVLHLHLVGQARHPGGGRWREDEPPGKVCAFAHEKNRNR